MPNSFYSLEQYSCQDHNVVAAIRFNPRHSIFAGHFPGQPVVPGVCMVQIVKQLALRALGRENMLLSQAHQLKFLQLIVPEQEALIDIDLKLKEEDKGYAVQASFTKAGAAVFKMTGVFTTLL